MMSGRIFVDTSAFLALEDESDQHHREAIGFRDQELLSGNYELVTTSYILDETLTLIRKRLGIRASIDFSRSIRKSGIVRVISVSREVEDKALDLFERYDDKDFSFTDCVSFVVMNDLGLRDAFTFAEHFVQVGFAQAP